METAKNPHSLRRVVKPRAAKKTVVKSVVESAAKFSVESTPESTPESAPESVAVTAAAAASSSLQSEYDAQTTRLREMCTNQQPKNTTKSYKPKQKEWEEWCARLKGNTDGSWVTEDKLCLFLEQEVINRESRAPGYEARKRKRIEMWKESEQIQKKPKTDEKTLNKMFAETVRSSVINSYVSAITQLHAWQSPSPSDPSKSLPPLRGAKLSALLDNIYRDQNRVQRVNFTDRGLFTIASGHNIKKLKEAISWCWKTASENPRSTESCLRMSAEYLLGLPIFFIIQTFFKLY